MQQSLSRISYLCLDLQCMQPGCELFRGNDLYKIG